jgi:hypothetical protein
MVLKSSAAGAAAAAGSDPAAIEEAARMFAEQEALTPTFSQSMQVCASPPEPLRAATAQLLSRQVTRSQAAPPVSVMMRVWFRYIAADGRRGLQAGRL